MGHDIFAIFWIHGIDLSCHVVDNRNSRYINIFLVCTKDFWNHQGRLIIHWVTLYNFELSDIYKHSITRLVSSFRDQQ